MDPHAAPAFRATRFTCESVIDDAQTVGLLEIPDEGQPRATVRIDNAAPGFFREGAVYAVLIADVERVPFLPIVPVDRCPSSGGVHDFYPILVNTDDHTAHGAFVAATVLCRWCATPRTVTYGVTGGPR